MDPSELEALLHHVGAIQQGHFLLSSGMHSTHYIQCALLLQYPQHAERVGRALAGRFSAQAPSVVIGPAYGGMIVAHEVARALGARAVFAERVEGRFELRRSFEIAAGEPVLVVEDVVTTGASTLEVKRVAERQGGRVIGVGAVVDRSAGPLAFDAPFHALLTIQVETHIAALCPMCAAGEPIVKPGSRSPQSAVGAPPQR
ncbi:MAG TPA: orotate phosphoribosyltransferase [bacterium]